MSLNLYGKLRHILNTRGITPGANDIKLVDNADGSGPRIDYWNTTRLGALPSAEAIDAVTDDEATDALPRYVDSRVMLTRMTNDENFKIMKIAQFDAVVAKFMNIFLSRAGKVDVHDPLSKAGWAYVKSVGLAPPAESGVAAIWADQATADARITAITAP